MGKSVARFAIVALALVIGASGSAFAQTAKAKPQFRKLVDGVETTIPIQWDAGETVAKHDIVDLINRIPDLEYKPNDLPQTATLFEKAKAANFRRTIWNLEFTFKPLRMVRVDIPQPNGTFERKVIWYMVYRVKNKGQHLVPKERAEDDKAEVDVTVPKEEKIEIPYQKGSFAVDRVDQPEGLTYAIRFVPSFTLECPKVKPPKAYRDHIIPLAMAPIREREDPNRSLANTVEIAGKSVKVSSAKEDNSVWGVVTWEDIDPTADFYSIYIKGLTNAYKWEDKPESIKSDSPPMTGRTFKEKTLKLNFWRSGDEFELKETEIRRGQPDDVDYDWVWR